MKIFCWVRIQMGLIILEEAREGAGLQQNKFNQQGCILKLTLCRSVLLLTALTDAFWRHIKIFILLMTFWFISL